MTSFGERLINNLEDLLDKLNSDDALVITEVIRVETPDGPMHIRREVVPRKKRGDCNDN